MIPEFAIGSSFPPMPFQGFTPPLPWPVKSNPEPFSVVFDRTDGSKAGMGFARTELVFQFLEQDELDHLLDLLTVSGTLRKSRTGIYLRTTTPEDQSVFATYRTIMLLPDGLSQARQPGGYYAGLKFEFRHLEAYP